MKMYRIRHNPTGLFFKPSKWPYKSNLSKNGKTYSRKPSLKYLGEYYYHPLGQNHRSGWSEYETRNIVSGDWEIVEYDVVNES